MSERVTRAVWTAALPSQVHLPLQTLVDRDGTTKPLLRIFVEELENAGIEELVVVVAPGAAEAYREASGPTRATLHFVVQEQPLGYGDALCHARERVGDHRFLHAVSDHLFLSTSAKSCARQLLDVAERERCTVSAVQATRESALQHFGTVGGRLEQLQTGLYRVETVREKPTPTVAEQELVVAGLRAGHYLCFFGMHVLNPGVMEDLEQQRRDGGPISLTAALDRLARRERYLALEIEGRRQDLGQKYGLFLAQLALGLCGADRDELLTELVQLLAQQPGERAS